MGLVRGGSGCGPGNIGALHDREPLPYDSGVALLERRDQNSRERNEPHFLLLMKSGSPLITSLLAPRSPSAVIWLVMAIVIDPVKRKARWAAAHVFKECCKIVPPTLTNSDPSSSPEVVFGVLRVEAPLLHAVPCAIFPTPTRDRRFPVRDSSSPSTFIPKTAATQGQAPYQIAPIDNLGAPALAFTRPHRPSSIPTSGLRGQADNGKSTEDSADQVCARPHLVEPHGMALYHVFYCL